MISNGLTVALDQPIEDDPITLQIRRAVAVTIISPEVNNKFNRRPL
jgi:hypothetical protein